MYLRMSRTNEESLIRPQLEERAQREMDNPMASLQERLDVVRPWNGGAPPVGKEKSIPK